MKSAPAFLAASGREAEERHASGPSQSMQVRTLGWHIPDSTAEDLFSRLYAAVASIGTMELSGDSVGSLIFTATVHDSPPAGGQAGALQEPMTALLWVVPSPMLGGHHVCIRRASGDTFVYHNFYRKVRQAMARCTGWREELRLYQTPQDATVDGCQGVARVPSCEYDHARLQPIM